MIHDVIEDMVLFTFTGESNSARRGEEDVIVSKLDHHWIQPTIVHGTTLQMTRN